jgi:hypothetical protein
VAIDLPPEEEVPSPVDARDARGMIEIKFDEVEESRPPKLHDSESGIPARSTYGAEGSSQVRKWTPPEQILDYDCLALAAQGPVRQHMFGLLITFKQFQIMYADRAGCMISEERNVSDDFGILFAVLIGLYMSEARRAGLQSGITVLSGPGGTPLDPSDFDTSDRVVQTGAMTNIGRPITPLQVQVQLASAPGEDVNVYACGVNLMERPMAIEWDPAQHKSVRTRPSIPREAKSRGLEKSQAIAVSQGESATLRRQYAPRSIFGSGTARYQCVLDANMCEADRLTLQLSWQPKNRLSEVTVLRIANDFGIPGVPTLVASSDIADAGDSLIRSGLQRQFAGLPSIRPVNKVLRATVLKEQCIPLSSVDNMCDFLPALISILKGKLWINLRGE